MHSSHSAFSSRAPRPLGSASLSDRLRGPGICRLGHISYDTAEPHIRARSDNRVGWNPRFAGFGGTVLAAQKPVGLALLYGSIGLSFRSRFLRSMDGHCGGAASNCCIDGALIAGAGGPLPG
jgi:hypothetical protein